MSRSGHVTYPFLGRTTPRTNLKGSATSSRPYSESFLCRISSRNWRNCPAVRAAAPPFRRKRSPPTADPSRFLSRSIPRPDTGTVTSWTPSAIRKRSFCPFRCRRTTKRARPNSPKRKCIPGGKSSASSPECTGLMPRSIRRTAKPSRPERPRSRRPRLRKRPANYGAAPPRHVLGGFIRSTRIGRYSFFCPRNAKLPGTLCEHLR